MKKLIALLLALLMVATVALVSCSGNKGTTGDNADNGANTEEDNGLVIPEGAGTSDTTDTGSDTTDTSEGGNNNNNQNTSNTFVDVATQFSVYTYTTTKIRSAAKMSAGEVTSVETSAQLTVIAKNDEWYKVKYGADEGYVLQDFVTANKDDTIFTELNEADYKTIQVKGNAEEVKKVNIRQYPIIADEYLSQSIKTLTYVETANNALVKIGENASGTWYKVKYDNGIYYLKINSSTKPILTVDGVDLDSSAGGI